jgi:hypothetical protein
MSALYPESCASCRRPWCSTLEGVRRHRWCPFCGAESIQTGSPSPCRACGETLREAVPGGLCGFCEELAAT